MIITSLSLENIRSYSKAEFEFEDGITFLSGDIGSGKSTILQAIEFALFGFKRNDLDGAQLLRRGHNKGSITLNLKKGKEEIEILRTLKKTKTGVSQENGYIKQAGALIELSPVELNAHIFELLHFPKSFLNKDRHLIYRFCVYTPQEELKEILFAPVDKRLEVIRKLFSIDKYKQLQNGIEYYTKDLRDKKINLKAKLEDKSAVLEEKEKLNQELKNISKELQVIEKKLEPVENDKNVIEKKEKELISERDKYENYLLKIQKELGKFDIIDERIRDFQNEIDNLKEFFESTNEEKLDEEKNKLDKEKKILNDKLKDKSSHIETLNKEKENYQIYKFKLESLKKLKEDLDKLDISSKEKIELEIKDLKKKRKNLTVDKKDKIIAEKEKLNERYYSLITQQKSLKKNFDFLTHKKECPTCYQEIDQKHKIELEKKQEKEQNKLDIELNEISTKYKALVEEIDNIEKSQNKIDEIDKKLIQLEEQNKNIKKIIEDIENKKKQINLLEKEIDSFEFTFDSFEKLCEHLKKEENEKEELKEKINQLKIDYYKTDEKSKQYKDKLDRKNKIEEKINSYQEKLKKKPEYVEKEGKISSKLNELKEQLDKLKKKKEDILPQIEKLTKDKTIFETNHINYKKQLDVAEKNFEKLEKREKELQAILNQEHFLQKEANQIASAIEKKLFTKFYIIATQEFQRIFRELIEDHELDVRLDEEFSILIEQNGYDIDIKHLSGGEKSSLAIAYKLALKKTIESFFPQEHYLDVLLLDEPTDGFSAEQVQRLGQVLQELSVGQIFLVSHDSTIEGIAQHEISIDKKHHLSSHS